MGGLHRHKCKTLFEKYLKQKERAVWGISGRAPLSVQPPSTARKKGGRLSEAKQQEDLG
jgi:hypothetical protein